MKVIQENNLGSIEASVASLTRAKGDRFSWGPWVGRSSLTKLFWLSKAYKSALNLSKFGGFLNSMKRAFEFTKQIIAMKITLFIALIVGLEMLTLLFSSFVFLFCFSLFIFITYMFWVWEFGIPNSRIRNSVIDLNFGLYYPLHNEARVFY